MIYAINRTDAIGDTILTLPMAQLIKKTDPKSRVIFIISERTEDLFINHSFVDDVWVLPPQNTAFKNFFYLLHFFKKTSIDHYCFAGGSHLPSFVAWITRVKIRSGLLAKWPSFLWLNKGMRQKRSQVEKHEAQYNLDLLQIPYNRENSHWSPVISLSENEQKLSWSSLEQMARDQNIILKKEMVIIHPGMTGHTLNWPMPSYARLINMLFEQHGNRFTFVVSYTPADQHYINHLKKELSVEGIFYFNGAILGLRHYMSILGHAKLFIAPSTGPLHIANALGVKTLGIYSPLKVQSTKRWRPFFGIAQASKTISPAVECPENVHCAGEKCPFYECMSKISVEETFKLGQDLLS